MKPISSQLASHITGEVTTLAICWKLTRKDSVVLAFTSHDSDIIVDGVTYKADSGFLPSAVASGSNLAVDNLEIEGIIDEVAVKEEEIRAGLYDFAAIEIFIVNYKDLAQGAISLRSGWIGEVQYGKGRFNAEVRGLMQSMTKVSGELYSPSCRANFGDLRCKINAADYTVTGAVTSVGNAGVFFDSARSEDAGYFTMGKITFTSGNNVGLAMEIKEFASGGLIKLVFPMPYAVQVGDEYSMQAGCDKSFDTCIAKFNNAVNFRGEPNIPGIDAMLKTAGTK